MKKLIILFSVVFFLIVPLFRVQADELDDVNKQLDNLKQQLDMSLKATKPLEKEVQKLQKELNSIRLRVNQVEKGIAQKEKEIEIGDKALVYQKQLLDERARSYYKNIGKSSFSLLQFLAGESLSLSLRNVFYQRSLVNEDRRMIVKIVLYIKDIEKKKTDLEAEKVKLAQVNKRIDKQESFLSGEINKAKKYQSELKSKIAQLTTKQKQLIAQKLAGLNLPTSLGAGPLYCTDDRNLNPGFSPAFAFYTFGIPHRVGMNQYGALGRAKEGQNYETILRAYFNNINFEEGKENTTIKVQGHGEMPLDEYLLGLYEMPESWPIEALKAQVIAARSYALAYTNNGQNEICTTQSCQVWKSDKKTGQWKQAVEETRGKIMTYNGEIVKAWYSSTDGGYTFTSSDIWGSNKGWTKRLRDTSGDINSFSDLTQKAYDKDSPCFYAAQGWRNEYGKSAWLKSEEVADIANVILLSRLDSSIREHLYQIDKPNPAGVDNWDYERVKQEIKNRGGNPFSQVSSVSASADFGLGKTNNITISEGGRSENFSGSEFKDFFNLRAPANIQIVGPLYNIEKK